MIHQIVMHHAHNSFPLNRITNSSDTGYNRICNYSDLDFKPFGAMLLESVLEHLRFSFAGGLR